MHSLAVVKAKGFANDYRDELIAVGEEEPGSTRKIFRRPRDYELDAIRSAADVQLEPINGYAAVPNEAIPPGSRDNVRASGYGYRTYGLLMNARQSLLFATTARTISNLHVELAEIVSPDYARALAGYAASNVMRQIRRSTRGAGLLSHGNALGTRQNRCQTDHVFSSQSVVKHQFDYLEAGPYYGPGSWFSVSSSLLNALKKVLAENCVGGRPARFRRASSSRCPVR